MRRVLETSGPVAVRVTSAAGRIELETADGTASEVELTPIKDDEQTRDAIAEATVELRREGGTEQIVIEVPKRRRWGFSDGARVYVRIRCPEGSFLEVRSASADVEARGRLRAAKIETASGDVRLEEVDAATSVSSASGDVVIGIARGEADVDTASGDVRAGTFEADGRIRTASGDVHVEDADGSLTVQTASGDQRVEAVRAGSVTLQSASGDIQVGVRKGSSLRLDARSMSGDLSSEIELGEEPPADAGDDGPLVHVKAVSMSGDVRIERAPEAVRR
jgi:DUF4097 and DUF4098 domain-containing protein YvlB